eukprot:1178892-Prorocentrum_minimum.AAC.5
MGLSNPLSSPRGPCVVADLAGRRRLHPDHELPWLQSQRGHLRDPGPRGARRAGASPGGPSVDFRGRSFRGRRSRGGSRNGRCGARRGKQAGELVRGARSRQAGRCTSGVGRKTEGAGTGGRSRVGGVGRLSRSLYRFQAASHNWSVSLNWRRPCRGRAYSGE